MLGADGEGGCCVLSAGEPSSCACGCEGKKEKKPLMDLLQSESQRNSSHLDPKQLQTEEDATTAGC